MPQSEGYEDFPGAGFVFPGAVLLLAGLLAGLVGPVLGPRIYVIPISYLFRVVPDDT